MFSWPQAFSGSLFERKSRKVPQQFYELPARNSFTTFCHQKVAPKVSAGHLRRERTQDVTERSRKTSLLRCKRLHRFDCGGSVKSASGLCARLLPVVRTIAPGVPSFVRSVSVYGAMQRLRCAARNYYLRSDFLQAAGLHDRTAQTAKSVHEHSGACPFFIRPLLHPPFSLCRRLTRRNRKVLGIVSRFLVGAQDGLSVCNSGSSM